MRDSANFKIQEGKDALGEKYSPYPESGSDDGDRPALMKQYDSNLEMMCMIGMWINGILNNFGYVILNTAAETIFPGKAGLVLFFNIVPGLMIKLAVPFFAHLISYRTKVSFDCFFILYHHEYRDESWYAICLVYTFATDQA